MYKKIIMFIILINIIILNSNAVLNTGNIAYYSMDSNTGQLIDNSGNNNLLINSNALSVNGLLNQATLFNGLTTTYLTAPTITNSQLQGDISFNAWINPNSIPNQGDILSSDNYPNLRGFLLEIQATGYGLSNTLLFGINTPTGQTLIQTPTNSININTWVMVTASWDSINNNMKVYINGILSNTITRSNLGTGSVNLNNANLFIGRGSNVGQAFNGIIDEVGIYNKVLTNTDILQLYNNGLGFNPFANPINLNIINPINNFNYTFDISNISLNLNTAISTNCSYTYNNNTFSFINTGNLNHNTLFNLPIATNQSQQLDINFNCGNGIYSQQKQVTIFKQRIPLNLKILVPKANQIFNINTQQIEFFLQTNYVTNCKYKRDFNSNYTIFTQTNSAFHKSNFTTDLNISTYNLNFLCEGVFISENVSKNITFFLDNLNKRYGLDKTTKSLPQVGADVGGFIKNISSPLANFILNFAIISSIILLFTALILSIKRYI